MGTGKQPSRQGDSRLLPWGSLDSKTKPVVGVPCLWTIIKESWTIIEIWKHNQRLDGDGQKHH